MPIIIRNIFEDYVKEQFSLQDCIAVNNGSSAIIAPLWSLGLEPGDEVITTPFTFISTVTSIIIAGGTPVFVDINEHDSLINADKIESAITSKTKAIMPVHLFGRVCDMKRINEIAEKHELVVIEDTSQSFGAECTNTGKMAGLMSDCGTFSFQKTKNINTFEGGMICIPKGSKLDAKKVRAICNQGQTSKYHHEYLGFNFRLAEPLCLLAYNQMKLHMTAIKSELGYRNETSGHYPYVVYDQPAIKKLGINGNCPVAEKKAKFIKENYFKGGRI